MNGSATIVLGGDTMLGRGVAAAIGERPDGPFVAPEIAEITNAADLFVLNLECCITGGGSLWPDPAKPFFFRAPPEALRLLEALGVSCVSLANNHALDFDVEGLLDTFRHLREAGIRWVGSGTDAGEARTSVVLEAGGFKLGIVALTDHPADFAATSARPGTAYAELRRGVPRWVTDEIGVADADAVLVMPHWGPNMTLEPLPYVRAAARRLVEAGATVVAGHSAHLVQGIEGRVLYDLGDFLDDYAVDPILRNDLGLLFLLTLSRNWPVRLEAVPLKLEYCFTRLAAGEEAAWIAHRFRDACRRLGTAVHEEDGRLLISWPEKA